jgi:hypothetical protein
MNAGKMECWSNGVIFFFPAYRQAGIIPSFRNSTIPRMLYWFALYLKTEPLK